MANINETLERLDALYKKAYHKKRQQIDEWDYIHAISDAYPVLRDEIRRLQEENAKLRAAYERCMDCPLVCIKDDYLKALDVIEQAKVLEGVTMDDG